LKYFIQPIDTNYANWASFYFNKNLHLNLLIKIRS